MELQGFWLTNTCRLLYDMKQYSGDKVIPFSILMSFINVSDDKTFELTEKRNHNVACN